MVKVFATFELSLLDYAGTFGTQKTYDIRNTFAFEVPRLYISAAMAQWAASYGLELALPKGVPERVLRDYDEAVRAFNVGAYRASACMARRALQQALEDKGVSRDNLQREIEEAREKKLLDGAQANLAHGVRIFGNYGAHPTEDLLEPVSEDDAKLALTVLGQILKKLYSQP